VPGQENNRINAIKQFSRFADHYDTYNVIQTQVAKELIARLGEEAYHTVIDIGSGSGQVYKNLKHSHVRFERFMALDSSEQMLSLHPSDDKILKIHADFNAHETYERFDISADKNLLVSSSALQWSKDLDFVFKYLSHIAAKAKFAIFTSNTFKTLHTYAHVESPIYSPETLSKSIRKYYDADFELKAYKLVFESVREMFSYIKKSGVSGGEKQLSYKQIKDLMYRYPLDHLEFEVLFVEAASLAYTSEPR